MSRVGKDSRQSAERLGTRMTLSRSDSSQVVTPASHYYKKETEIVKGRAVSQIEIPWFISSVFLYITYRSLICIQGM